MPEEDFSLKVTFFGKFGSDRLTFPITPFFVNYGSRLDLGLALGVRWSLNASTFNEDTSTLARSRFG